MTISSNSIMAEVIVLVTPLDIIQKLFGAVLLLLVGKLKLIFV